MSTHAIEVLNLSKHFGAVKAVADLSFTVRPGEIFSLLGPNGAGKTTAISMLICLLQPDQGDVRIFGHSVRAEQQQVKAALGVVPQEIALYEDLSAYENLAFWGRMYGLSGAVLRQRVAEVLALIGLSDQAKGRVGKYSGGMKRRLNIGIALLHQPRLLIMDEPTVGIDPQSRRSILDGVKALNQAGTTVLYTTHYMEEAQEISDRIAILDHGRLLAQGTHAELIRLVGEQARIDLTLSADSPALLPEWQALPGVAQVYAENGHVSTLVDDSNRVLPHLFETASRKGVRITGIDIREPNLETVFLQLTGRGLRN